MNKSRKLIGLGGIAVLSVMLFTSIADGSDLQKALRISRGGPVITEAVTSSLEAPVSSDNTSDSHRRIPPASYAEFGDVKQSGIIDKHLSVDNKLRTLQFCAQTHLARIILIDGSDVLQNISDVMVNDNSPKDAEGNNLGSAFCASIPSKFMGADGVIETPDVKKLSSHDPKLGADVYHVVVSSYNFVISQSSRDIYLVDAYDGALIGPIGKNK